MAEFRLLAIAHPFDCVVKICRATFDKANDSSAVYYDVPTKPNDFTDMKWHPTIEKSKQYSTFLAELRKIQEKKQFKSKEGKEYYRHFAFKINHKGDKTAEAKYYLNEAGEFSIFGNTFTKTKDYLAEVNKTEDQSVSILEQYSEIII